MKISLFILLAKMAHAARILAITPMPFFSHQHFFRPIWRELAQRGHQVVLITSAPMPATSSNLHQIDISIINQLLPTARFSNDYNEQMRMLSELTLMLAEAQMSSDPIQQLLGNASERFDIVVAEFFCPVMFSFKRRFNASALIIHSPMDIMNMWYDSTGSPSHELLYSFIKEINMAPSLFERVRTLLAKLNQLDMTMFTDQIDAAAKKYFGEDALTMVEVQQEVDLIMINTNMVLQPVRPLSPSVIPLGGGMFLQFDRQMLSADISVLLDESSQGVIYFSLGTYINTSTLSDDTLTTIASVFSMLPYTILWKTDVLPESIVQSMNQSGNIHTRKWLPQPNILSHKNVKLFITQGGMLSLEESIILKKPLIVIPIMADQHANAHRIEALQLGARLDINTMTPVIFKQSIDNVLNDRRIAANLDKYALLLQDQPLPPLERAVWWIEYVIRHKGARHLHARTLPWWQLAYVDAILLIGLATIPPLWIALKILLPRMTSL